MNIKDLVTKATQGVLSKRELEEVVSSLQKGSDDPYYLLLIIGRAGARDFRWLVERYLQPSDDPMLARLAIQILCSYWGLAAQYREILERFIRKVPWDNDDDARLMAISCAGYLLAEEEDQTLLSLLFAIFHDESELQIIREAAYHALGIAAGKKPNELPPASRHFDLRQDIDHRIIDRITERLSLHDRA